MLLFPPKHCVCAQNSGSAKIFKNFAWWKRPIYKYNVTHYVNGVFFQKKFSFGTNGNFWSKHDSSSINQQSLLDWSTSCCQNVGNLAILNVKYDGELELVSDKIMIILLSQMSI